VNSVQLNLLLPFDEVFMRGSFTYDSLKDA
jgi:hypothetical protein